MKRILLISVLAVCSAHAADPDAERAAEIAKMTEAAIEASCGATTVLEAIECLNESLPQDDHDLVVSTPFEDLSRFHHGWGTGIRNGYGLWIGTTPISQHMRDIGLQHPDDMSGVLINSYWLHFNGCDLRLDDQVAFYRAWWSEGEDVEDGEVFDWPPSPTSLNECSASFAQDAG